MNEAREFSVAALLVVLVTCRVLTVSCVQRRPHFHFTTTNAEPGEDLLEHRRRPTTVGFEPDDQEFGPLLTIAAALHDIAIRAPEGFAEELADRLAQG